MNHIEMSKRIQNIEKSFKIELKQTNVLDSDNNVKHKRAFEIVIDHALDELNKLESLVASEAGIVSEGNRETANVLFSAIEKFKAMRASHSMDPNSISANQLSDEELINKPSALSKGRKLLSGLIKRFSTKKPVDKTKSR